MGKESLDHPPVNDVRNRPPIRPSFLLAIAITVLLISLISAALKPRYGPRSDTKIHATIAQLANLKAAIEFFHTDTGRYPTTAEGLAALIERPSGLTAWGGPYIDKIPTDAWGSAFIYRFPNPTNPTPFDLHSIGPDKIDGTPDDLTPQMPAP